MYGSDKEINENMEIYCEVLKVYTKEFDGKL